MSRKTYTFYATRECMFGTTITIDVADVEEGETMEDIKDFAYQMALDADDWEASDQWITKPELTLVEEDT